MKYLGFSMFKGVKAFNSEMDVLKNYKS